jgi:hypothetical protein
MDADVERVIASTVFRENLIPALPHHFHCAFRRDNGFSPRFGRARSRSVDRVLEVKRFLA